MQVVKDPIGTKGARLTTFVALPSRLLVYMPRGDGVGVSARIEDEAERARLKALVAEAVPQQTVGGYIVRTAAEGATTSRSARTSSTSAACGQHVKERGMRARAGELVYEDLPLPTRVLRDELARGVDRVLVETPRRTRACWSSRPASCRAAPRASSSTPASGRSSTCTASRRRSARRSSAAST